MKIKRDTYMKILDEMPIRPPEKGGILGKKDEVIVVAQVDEGIDSRAPCSYTPNVDFLNEIIEQWSEMNIDFAGVFHTHFYGVDTLSRGDEMYIKKIHLSMPEGVNKLHFPIILPELKKIVSYISIRNNNKIIIEKDTIKQI